MIFYIKVNDCPYTETVEWWYNEIRMKHYNTREYYTTNQIRMQLDFEKIIEISDPVYTFSEVMAHIDLKKYYTVKESVMGRPRYDAEKLLKVILFAFMENGYSSLRNIEKSSMLLLPLDFFNYLNTFACKNVILINRLFGVVYILSFSSILQKQRL